MDKITALLAEDDAIDAFLSKKILNSIGITREVYLANSGKEALQIFNRCFSGAIGLPDLILLDLSYCTKKEILAHQ